MTFRAGQSGNPHGRPKGALSRRTHLAKLLEPHAESLVAKMIELALSGDVNALRLCIERLIPKMQQQPVSIDLPKKLNQKTIPGLKDSILRLAFAGEISLDHAERLAKLVAQFKDSHSPSTADYKIPTNDPIEASRIYQRIMLET